MFLKSNKANRFVGVSKDSWASEYPDEVAIPQTGAVESMNSLTATHHLQ